MPSPTYLVGDLRLIVVSDGTVWMDAGAVFGLVPKIMWQRITTEVNSRNQIPLALNCLLLQSDGKTILIETGQGNKDFDLIRRRGGEIHHGLLINELSANGVTPSDIDIVINTHLHSDHTGWNTRLVNGTLVPTFPNARYYIQRGEWKEATNPNERTRATYRAENLNPVHAADQIDLIDGETKITSNITVIETPGHTADHASVVITNGGETAVYLGDVVQHKAQLEHTAWGSAFDILPLVAMETKRRLVEEAIMNQHLLICVHNSFPGGARMKRIDGQPHYIPEAPHE